MAAPYPWLVHSHGKNYRSHTFSTITNPNETHLRRFPHSKHKKFWASCHDGWSLSSDANHRQFFLWNLVKLMKITLPPLNNFKGSIEHCTFTSPPTHPDCMILLSATDLPLILCLRRGDQQWTELNYENEVTKCLKDSGELDDRVERYNPLRIFSCNGDLYAQTYTSRLLLIEELKPNHGIVLRSLRLSFPRDPFCGVNVRRFLVEFEGKIYWILFRFGTIKNNEEVVAVDIHGLDLSKMIWEKVEHVPDLAFFVHDTCSFCCQAIEPEIHGNRIYFSSNKILYSYNIGDRTLSADSLPLPNIVSPYSSFWVMPDQSIIAQEDYTEVQVQGREISNVMVKKLGGTGQVEEERKYCDHYLPLDVADKIFGYVNNLVDYLHLQATHTMFRSMPFPVDWKKATPSLSPWLIFLEKDGVCSLVDPRYGDKYLINLPPPLSSCNICYSKNGWLLMSGNVASTFLFNPFTKQIVQFPKENNVPEGRIPTSYMAFSSYPTLDCVLVEINKCDWREVELNYTRLGGESWTQLHFPCWNHQDSHYFDFYDNSPVFYEGAFYCSGHRGNLGVLEFGQHGVTWIVVPHAKPCSYQQNFLVECNGELLSVFVGKFGKRVHVFRLKHPKMTWIKVESLGNYMIYISRSSSIATMATIPGMENKIYFPRFCGQSGYNVVFYSLDTKKFHSFQSKDSEVDFYSTREQLFAGWIQPNWF